MVCVLRWYNGIVLLSGANAFAKQVKATLKTRHCRGWLHLARLKLRPPLFQQNCHSRRFEELSFTRYSFFDTYFVHHIVLPLRHHIYAIYPDTTTENQNTSSQCNCSFFLLVLPLGWSIRSNAVSVAPGLAPSAWAGSGVEIYLGIKLSLVSPVKRACFVRDLWRSPQYLGY